jgi:hypothetical protein
MNRSAVALSDRRAVAAPPARPLSEEQAWARAAAARSGFGASETARETPPA